jgi:hypothetical protein
VIYKVHTLTYCQDLKVEVKLELSLCLTKYHAMKTYFGSGGIAPRIHLGTRWRFVVRFTPRLLYPQEKSPVTHWIGGWVGLRAVLDAVVKRQIPSPCRESNTRPQSCSSCSFNVSEKLYGGVSRSFGSESVKKYTLATINTH